MPQIKGYEILWEKFGLKLWGNGTLAEIQLNSAAFLSSGHATCLDA